MANHSSWPLGIILDAVLGGCTFIWTIQSLGPTTPSIQLSDDLVDSNHNGNSVSEIRVTRRSNRKT